MKRNYTLSVISVLVLILFITLALGSGDTTEPERVERETPVEDTTTTPEGEPEVADEIFHVGETVKMGD